MPLSYNRIAGQSVERLAALSLSWIHILFLFTVSITPFSTTLLAEFPEYRTALVAYWVNILLLGSTLYFSWVCAMGTGLVKDDLPPDVPEAIKRRILVGQGALCRGRSALYL